MAPDLQLRRLARDDAPRVAEIDRTERIDVLYVQRGTELIARPGDWSSPPWHPTGDGEHSVAAQVRAVQHLLDEGGMAVGAFLGDRLVGIGVLVPHLRPGIAQLAYLHITAAARGEGLGTRLCEELEQLAREAGDTEMVVSATPSANTVRFYRGRGFELMAEPLPELFTLEPEDVHLHKAL